MKLKKYLVGFICLFQLSFALGQITLTNRIFPVVLDVFNYSIDSNLSNYTISAAGPDQKWDFHNLKETGSGSMTFRNPASGQAAASFPTANAMIRKTLQEQYLKIGTNKIEELGSFIRGSAQLPISGVSVNPKPVIIQRVPWTYEDELDYQTNVFLPFSTAFLPDSLFNGLPLKPDSIRIKINTTVNKLVDAWGKLTLPAKNWDVIREKRTTTSTILIEAKIPFLGWLDVTTIVKGLFSGLFNSGTTVSYGFMSNDAKGDVLEISVDTSGKINGIQFKPDPFEVSVKDHTHSNTISLSNYCFSDMLTVESLPLGSDMTISIVDLNGKIVYAKRMLRNESNVVLSNLAYLPKAIYVLTVNDNNKTIYTAKITKE